jgi:hypothetical protein
MNADVRYTTQYKKIWRACFLGNAMVWAAVILLSAMVLQGRGLMGGLVPIFAGGAAASMIVLSRVLRHGL